MVIELLFNVSTFTSDSINEAINQEIGNPKINALIPFILFIFALVLTLRVLWYNFIVDNYHAVHSAYLKEFELTADNANYYNHIFRLRIYPQIGDYFNLSLWTYRDITQHHVKDYLFLHELDKFEQEHGERPDIS